MKLENFELEKPAYAIGLNGLGRYWDFHAFASFRAIEYIPSCRTAELEWIAPPVDNPWGDKRNLAKGCRLRFKQVTMLFISEAPEEGEEDCVASISLVSKPAAVLDLGEFRVMDHFPTNDEEVGLLFKIQNGRTIEIHSKSVELIAI